MAFWAVAAGVAAAGILESGQLLQGWMSKPFRRPSQDGIGGLLTGLGCRFIVPDKPVAT